MSPKPYKTRTSTSTFEHPCAKCLATIRVGDPVKQEQLETGARVWVHIDCRGRFEREIGVSPGQIEAARPTPSAWNTRPRCPECGAFMAKTGEDFVCGMHVPPIYQSGDQQA